jgi:hypothetical protein
MIQDEYHDFYAQTLYSFSYGIVPMCIAGVGFFGNLLVTLVYTLRPKFANNSLKLYFISLALTDTLSLFLSLKIFVANFRATELELISNVTCKLSEFVDFMLPAISAWTRVVIACDRMVKIVYPRRMQFMNRRLFQAFLILAVFVFNILAYMPSLLFRRIIEVEMSGKEPHQHWHRAKELAENGSNHSTVAQMRRTCHYKLNVLTSNWLHMVNSSLTPFLLMILFSSLTIFYIFKSRRKCFSRTTVHPASTSNQHQQPFTITSSSRVSPFAHTPSNFSRDNHFVLNSISLNFIFLFLTLPILVLNVISMHLQTLQFNPYLVSTCINLFYVNFASLLFVNLFSNSIFRSEFLLMLHLKKTVSIVLSQTNKSSVEQLNVKKQNIR